MMMKMKKSHTTFVGFAADTHGSRELEAKLTADFIWTQVCVAFCSQKKDNNDKCGNVYMVLSLF